MPKYIDVEILDQMRDVAYMMFNAAERTSDELWHAVADYDDAEPDAHRSYLACRKSLLTFDKRLAELITQRGQLAEATGIPMFSHIGESQRYPDQEDELL